MLEEMSIEIKKLKKNLKSFFTWLHSVYNTIVDEDAKPPIIENSKGILDFLHTAFSNTNNIFDTYFADIDDGNSIADSNSKINDENKTKSTSETKNPESFYDLIDKININNIVNLSSKLENWEEYISQKENERNNSSYNNLSSIYSEFGSFIQNDNDIDTKDIINSSFNLFNEENSILSNNSFYGSKKKVFDEDLQNSPKKQCISMDDEDSILIKYGNDLNEESGFLYEQKVFFFFFFFFFIFFFLNNFL